MSNQTATNMQATANMQDATNMQAISGGQQFLLHSNNPTNAVWTKQGVPVFTLNALANPVDQLVNATLVDLTALSAGQGFFQSVIYSQLMAHMTNCKSVWLRGFAGGEIVTMADPQLTIGVKTCPLTLNWQMFELPEKGQANTMGLWLRKNTGNKFYLYEAKVTLANNRGPETTPTTTSRILNPILNIP